MPARMTRYRPTTRRRTTAQYRTTKRPRNRRGVTVLEVVVATLLLLAAMGLAVQTLRSMSFVHRDAERRRIALEEASNILERLTAGPWDGVTPEAAGAIRLPDDAARLLPGAELIVTVSPDDAGAGPLPLGTEDARRVQVQLRWQTRSGDFDSPVRLTTWIHRRSRP